jgi:hypothetical protein
MEEHQVVVSVVLFGSAVVAFLSGLEEHQQYFVLFCLGEQY